MAILWSYHPFTKFSFHPTPLPSYTCASTFKPKTPNTPILIPARDRVIEFGKHKGKMLGSLPSSYLKWVSKNLRARDFEEWATLADQVLQDPIYQDRIQWEFAQTILSGDRNHNNNHNSSVSELVELSERFGWDNKDKSGWKNINFELLGTSKGGRIPRINIDTTNASGVELESSKTVSNEEEGGIGRRRERRDRQRLKMKMKTDESSRTENDMKLVVEEERGGNGNGNGNVMLEKRRGKNPFPGRESLLKNVLNRNTK